MRVSDNNSNNFFIYFRVIILVRFQDIFRIADKLMGHLNLREN